MERRISQVCDQNQFLKKRGELCGLGENNLLAPNIPIVPGKSIAELLKNQIGREHGPQLHFDIGKRILLIVGIKENL